MRLNKLVRIGVGTNVSRPHWCSIADEDVIHWSLPSTYPHYFVKVHHRVLLAVNLAQGRDESIPTHSS